MASLSASQAATQVDIVAATATVAVGTQHTQVSSPGVVCTDTVAGNANLADLDTLDTQADTFLDDSQSQQAQQDSGHGIVPPTLDQAMQAVRDEELGDCNYLAQAFGVDPVGSLEPSAVSAAHAATGAQAQNADEQGQALDDLDDGAVDGPSIYRIHVDALFPSDGGCFETRLVETYFVPELNAKSICRNTRAADIQVLPSLGPRARTGGIWPMPGFFARDFQEALEITCPIPEDQEDNQMDQMEVDENGDRDEGNVAQDQDQVCDVGDVAADDTSMPLLPIDNQPGLPPQFADGDFDVAIGNLGRTRREERRLNIDRQYTTCTVCWLPIVWCECGNPMVW